MADPKFGPTYLAGDVTAVAEMRALNKTIANGPMGETSVGGVETIDGVTSTYAMPRAGYDALFDGMLANGMTPEAEQYIRDLDSGKRTDRPTEGDGKACAQALDRLMKDREWGRKVQSGDIQARKTQKALQNYKVLAAADGKPISEHVAEQLSRLGLR
jgi:hypothetical protein